MVKSLSKKLYLGIAVVALVMWFAGVPGQTILILGAVGFMVAMHAGGHGGGGHGGGGEDADEDRGASQAHSGHAGHASVESSPAAPVATTDTDTDRKPRGGCH